VDEEEQPFIFVEENVDEDMHDQDGSEGGDHPMGEDAIKRTQKMDYVATISNL